jgi:hypothetical protein
MLKNKQNISLIKFLQGFSELTFILCLQLDSHYLLISLNLNFKLIKFPKVKVITLS